MGRKVLTYPNDLLFFVLLHQLPDHISLSLQLYVDAFLVLLDFITLLLQFLNV